MELNKNNYFSKEAELAYMGSTQYKNFCDCQAGAMARITDAIAEEKSTAFLQGNLMDSLFENNFEQFAAEHPEMFSTRGSTAGQLKADYQKTLDVFNFLKQDSLFMNYCQGEQQQIFIGEIAGVPFKIMVDSLKDDCIVDRKFVRDFENIWSDKYMSRVPFFMKWGYDIQGAIYQEIVRQNIGKKLPFILAPATKEDVPDHMLIQMNDKLLEKALDEVIENAPLFQSIKDGLVDPTECDKCNYCKSKKRVNEIIMASDLFDYGQGDNEEE